MLRAEQVTWISEPTPEEKKHYEKYSRWPHTMLWQFTAQFENRQTHKMEPLDMKCYMGVEEHEVYLAELELLKQVGEIEHVLEPMRLQAKMKRALLDAIEKYGNAREQKGRDDVNEEWAERDAGASL